VTSGFRLRTAKRTVSSAVVSRLRFARACRYHRKRRQRRLTVIDRMHLRQFAIPFTAVRDSVYGSSFVRCSVYGSSRFYLRQFAIPFRRRFLLFATVVKYLSIGQKMHSTIYASQSIIFVKITTQHYSCAIERRSAVSLPIVTKFHTATLLTSAYKTAKSCHSSVVRSSETCSQTIFRRTYSDNRLPISRP